MRLSVSERLGTDGGIEEYTGHMQTADFITVGHSACRVNISCVNNVSDMTLTDSGRNLITVFMELFENVCADAVFLKEFSSSGSCLNIESEVVFGYMR